MDPSPPGTELTTIKSSPARTPLVPERTEFLDRDARAASKVEAFLAHALTASGPNVPNTAGALVP